MLAVACAATLQDAYASAGVSQTSHTVCRKEGQGYMQWLATATACAILFVLCGLLCAPKCKRLHVLTLKIQALADVLKPPDAMWAIANA